jgi:hypothetical protein
MVRHGLTHSELGKQARQRRRQLYWRRRLLWSVLIILALVGLVALTHWDKLLINQVRIEGAKSVPKANLEARLNAGLEGNYLYLFPRRNVLFWPRAVLTNNIANEFKALESFSLQREGRTLHLVVTERQGAYVWCGVESGATCYLLDSKGFAFAPAPNFSGRPFFTLIADLPAKPIASRPLTTEEFTQLLTTQAKLEPVVASSVIGGEVPAVDLRQAGDFNFQLQPEGKLRPISLRLGREMKLDQMLVDLEAALDSEAFVNEYNKNLAEGKPLLYLDYHVPGRIFYKFAE